MTHPTRLFPLGGPVSAQDVVDRDLFIDDLVERLIEGQSIVLSGPRRIGKSSVAAEVLRRVARRGAGTAAVNLEETTSPRELAGKLAAACLQTRSRVARLAIDTEAALARLLGSTSIRAKLHGIEVEALRHPEARPVEQYLDEAFRLPEQIALRTGNPMVVLFDEFQLVEALGAEALLHRMRSHFQEQRHTAFLFLGSTAGMVAELFGDARRAFYRFATALDLPPVPDDAWRRYLRGRYRSRGLAITQDGVVRLLACTGGHPYDTMQVAFETYLLARAGEATTIDSSLVAGGHDVALEHLAGIFDAELAAAGTYGRLVLGRIAKEQALYEDVRSQDSVRRTLESRVRGGVIRHVGHGRYEFTEPMLREHLRYRPGPGA